MPSSQTFTARVRDAETHALVFADDPDRKEALGVAAAHAAQTGRSVLLLAASIRRAHELLDVARDYLRRVDPTQVSESVTGAVRLHNGGSVHARMCNGSARGMNPEVLLVDDAATVSKEQLTQIVGPVMATQASGPRIVLAADRQAIGSDGHTHRSELSFDVDEHLDQYQLHIKATPTTE